MRTPSEEEFKEWLLHPVTRAMREVLERRRESNRCAWEGGSYSDWDSHTHAIINAGAIGECKGMAFVQELDYETLIGELDEERERAETPRGGGAGEGV